MRSSFVGCQCKEKELRSVRMFVVDEEGIEVEVFHEIGAKRGHYHGIANRGGGGCSGLVSEFS